MLIKNNVLYAGVSNDKGAELLDKGIVIDTGYTLVKITNGEFVGSRHALEVGENEKMFIEVKNNNVGNHFIKDNTIIAGVENEAGFDLCIKQENLYTGKKFLRVHDGLDFGNIIYLGNDYSYDKNGRVDLPIYYVEVEDVEETLAEN